MKVTIYCKGSSKCIAFWGRGEMSGITSSPPIRWTESNETHLDVVAPEIGFEPMTNWLTANCSTAELLRNMYKP
jgi:hypothetical protein